MTNYDLRKGNAIKSRSKVQFAIIPIQCSTFVNRNKKMNSLHNIVLLMYTQQCTNNSLSHSVQLSIEVDRETPRARIPHVVAQPPAEYASAPASMRHSVPSD